MSARAAMLVWPARAAMLVWPARAAMSSRLLRRALSSAPRSPPARPPLRLGALGGPCIANKASVLHEVDRALNPDDPRPPDVEVLLADHLAYTGNPLSRALHHNLIALGHLLVRYTTSDGKQWVMNILGGDALDRGGRMVNFGRPEDYLYGTAAYDGWCQQGGVYNRDFVGVRIERAPEGVADALHAYYRALEMRSEIRTDTSAASASLLDAPLNPRTASQALARFELFGGRINNFIAGHLPPAVSTLLEALKRRLLANARSVVSGGGGHALGGVGGAGPPGREDASRHSWFGREERLLSVSGNCAQWTTSGLQWVGLVRRPRLVPKAALIELFEREHRICPDNCRVVVYKRVPNCARFYEEYEPARSTLVHPLYFWRNLLYRRMDAFADVLVSVPEGSDVALVRRVPPAERRRPPAYLPYVNGAWIATTAAAILGIFDGPEPVRTISASACAAAWLVLNWWTY